MGLALAGILKTAAASLIGDKLKDIAVEKVTTVAREKLKLPPETPEADINVALNKNPEVYDEIVAEITEWRIEQERTWQIATQEQAETHRVEVQSESRFVKYARPAALWGAVASCLLLIVSGLVVVFTSVYVGDGQLFNYYVEFVRAASMPISILISVGGIYTVRRTTDKAIKAGFDLPSLFGSK